MMNSMQPQIGMMPCQFMGNGNDAISNDGKCNDATSNDGNGNDATINDGNDE